MRRDGSIADADHPPAGLLLAQIGIEGSTSRAAQRAVASTAEPPAICVTEAIRAVMSTGSGVTSVQIGG